MKCSNCGSELEENAKFCNFCGQPIKRKEHTKTKRLLIVSISLLALCIVSTLGGLIFNSVKRTHIYRDNLSLGNQYLLEMDYDNAISAFSEAIFISKREEALVLRGDAYVGKAQILQEKAVNAEDWHDTENLLNSEAEILSLAEADYKAAEEAGQESETGDFSDKYELILGLQTEMKREADKVSQIKMATELYGEVLDRYRYGIENGWTNTQNISANIFENSSLVVSDIGFAVVDVNNDGIMELLVSLMNEDGIGRIVEDIYTLDGNKPVWLNGSGSNKCYLHEDGDIYVTYDEEYDQTRILLTIEEAAIKYERKMILSASYGEYFYDHDKAINSHGYRESGIDDTSRDEFEKLLAEYDSRIKTYSQISLNAVKPVTSAEENERLFMTKYLNPLYADVLNDIIDSQILAMSYEELKAKGYSPIWSEDEVGYLLKDVDMNGTVELLIGLCGDKKNPGSKRGIAFYTIQSSAETGKYLVEVFESDTDDRYFYLLSGHEVELYLGEEWPNYCQYHQGSFHSYEFRTDERPIDYEFTPISVYTESRRNNT